MLRFRLVKYIYFVIEKRVGRQIGLIFVDAFY